MIVVDEYIAVRVLRGRWPAELPDDEDLTLPASVHWRLLQAVHGDRGGQLSQLFAGPARRASAPSAGRTPKYSRSLTPRPLLGRAAALANRYGGGLLIGETLAAGLVNGRQLFFGTAHNIGPRLRHRRRRARHRHPPHHLTSSFLKPPLGRRQRNPGG